MLIWVTIFTYCTFFLSQLLLHVSYYIRNTNTKLLIDEKNRTLQIIHNKETHNYKFEQIQFIEKNESTGGNNPFMVHDYWYVRIKFDDGKIYYWNCFLIRTNTFDLTGVSINYKSRFIPYIRTNNKNIEETQADKYSYILELDGSKIAELKTKFRNSSTEKLQNKLANHNKYTKEALIAAKEILAERDSTHDQ